MINTQVMEMLTNPIVIVISQYLSIKSSFFLPPELTKYYMSVIFLYSWGKF